MKLRKTTIIDEYIDYQDKYEKKYGDHVIVLMEVGSFFELYGVETEEEYVGKVSEHFQLTTSTFIFGQNEYIFIVI